MTLLSRRAALEAWLEHAEALLHDGAGQRDPEPEAVTPLEHSDAA